MIEFTTGDILRANTEALVNTVDCTGVMAHGIALQFKHAFPENDRAFRTACSREEIQPGRLFVFETGFIDNPRVIINFPTRRHPKGKSRMEDVEAGLSALVRAITERQIQSVAVPPLGSSPGGLPWPDVRRRIEEAVRSLPGVRVMVFEPDDTAERGASVARPAKAPRMAPGCAALLGLMRRYLSGVLDPFITLVEVHKLMYFMQEAGEPLKLRFVQAPYGPYAEDLRDLLAAIEGHYISGFGDGSEQPGRALSLVPGAAEEAEAFLGRNPLVDVRFTRIANLIDGFETPFGLELLATVHWTAKHRALSTAGDLLRAVYDWGPRKKQFTPRQIALAAEVLARQGWL